MVQKSKQWSIWVSAHENISDFYLSSLQRGASPWPLFVIRLLLTVAALGVLGWSVNDGLGPHWLIFLTNWGLLAVNLMMVSGTIISALAVIGKIRDDGEVLPWYISMQWVLSNVAVSIAILITILYWTLLYPDKGEYQTIRVFALDVSTHGMNSVLAVLELTVSRTPVLLPHFYQPIGVGVWYGLFSIIYFVAGGTDASGNPYIYALLDWRVTGRTSGVVIGSLVGIIVIYSVVWAWTYFRNKATGYLIRTTSHDPPYTPKDNDHRRMV